MRRSRRPAAAGAAARAIQQANQQAGTEQGALAASAAIQVDPSNDASPVRVLSPGSDGSVNQSNNAASSAHSGNSAATTQNANQSQAGESCGCSDGLGIQALGQKAETEQSSAALSAALQVFGGEPLALWVRWLVVRQQRLAGSGLEPGLGRQR